MKQASQQPESKNNQASGPFFQPQLTVNTPGDAYEQEADAVADSVMRMQEGDAPIVQRMPLTPVGDVQRKCANCEQEEAQRKETGSDSAGGKAAPGIVSDVLSSGAGRPMEGDTRQFMESRFGQDFSQVRIHTDSRAADSASAIQAKAYTSGSNIVFGHGQYQPESSSGKRLLAHELAHVGQQGGGENSSIQREGEGPSQIPQSATTEQSAPGTFGNPLIYEDFRDITWTWSLIDEDPIWDDLLGRFNINLHFAKVNRNGRIYWIVNAISGNRSSIRGITLEISSITTIYTVVAGRLRCFLDITLTIKTSDVTEGTQTEVGGSLTASDQSKLGAQIDGLSAGTESGRSAGLSLTKNWTSSRVLSGSVVQVGFRFSILSHNDRGGTYGYLQHRQGEGNLDSLLDASDVGYDLWSDVDFTYSSNTNEFISAIDNL